MGKSKSQKKSEEVTIAEQEPRKCPNCHGTKWEYVPGTNHVQEKCDQCGYVYTPE